MAIGLRGFAALRGKVVRENVSANGSRLLVHLSMAILASAALAYISAWAHGVVVARLSWYVDGVSDRHDGYYELSDLVPSSFHGGKPIYRKAADPPTFLYFVAEPQSWQLSSNHTQTTCTSWGQGDEVANVTAWHGWSGSDWQVDQNITVVLAEAFCDSSPVELGTWFQVMFVLQGVSCLLFLFIHCGLISLMDDLVTRGRTARALEPPAIPAPEPTQISMPAGGSGPAGPQPTAVPDPAELPGSAPAPPCPAETLRVASLWDACILSNVFCCTTLIFVLTGFLLLWSILGVLSAVDAAHHDNEACRSGFPFIWFLATVSFAQTMYCHIFTTTDAHAPRTQAPTLEVWPSPP